MEEDQKHWHLDKRVPIAMIVAIAFQTGAFIWWASDVNARVGILERQTSHVAPQAERIVRLEAQLDAIRDGLSEIKALLRRDRAETR